MKLIISLTLFTLFSQVAFAKRFASKYCEFELPAGWVCALEGSEYVCQSENEDRKKESIIILAAKIRGEQDSLDEYQAYLKKTKEYNLPGGKKQVSEPKYTKLTKVNDHQWVDALHLASEVPGFYTRYLATVKEDLGVAVTFSVTKDLYAEYQPIIDKMVSTLRVFRQKANTDLTPLRSGESGEYNPDDATFNPNPDYNMQANRTKKRAGDGGATEDLILYGALGIVALVVFLIAKNKKKKGKK